MAFRNLNGFWPIRRYVNLERALGTDCKRICREWGLPSSSNRRKSKWRGQPLTIQRQVSESKASFNASLKDLHKFFGGTHIVTLVDSWTRHRRRISVLCGGVEIRWWNLYQVKVLYTIFMIMHYARTYSLKKFMSAIQHPPWVGAVSLQDRHPLL